MQQRQNNAADTTTELESEIMMADIKMVVRTLNHNKGSLAM